MVGTPRGVQAVCEVPWGVPSASLGECPLLRLLTRYAYALSPPTPPPALRLPYPDTGLRRLLSSLRASARSAALGSRPGLHTLELVGP